MAKVRFAVIGAGGITQSAFLPAIALTPNASVSVLVSGSPEIARALADQYDIPRVAGYNDYDQVLADGIADAVYIALPNSLHADYAIRAANAGVHALIEKPLALTAEECTAMITAADAAGTYLMTAYRLHHDPGAVRVIEQVRAGAIGTPRIVSSVFSFQTNAGNHRLQPEHWGGPMQDLGVYCINAARHIFGAEPVEAVALSGPTDDPRFAAVDGTVAALLRFPGGGISQFTTSFGAGEEERLTIIGDAGVLSADPAYRPEQDIAFTVRRDGGEECAFPPLSHDHFAAQITYFADCVQAGTPPAMDGREGLADVVILRAIEEAARTGQAQTIDLPPLVRSPSTETARAIPRGTSA